MSLEHEAPNLYFDTHFNVEAAKILPGEYYVSKREMLLVTVLGSCVAACIWDSRAQVGGMNHFMLPDLAVDKKGEMGESGRYGVYAMELLVNQLLKLGAKKANLRAKVFGGGNVMKGFQNFDVGQRNSTFVKEFLTTERIPLVAEDLLDVWPRKVYFFTQSGKVLVKKLKSMHNDTIFKREIEYRSKLRNTQVSGDVELF
ncbi:chemoreceptor glutamine deamidase CheD [Parvibium lacunae]|uniref:Probable chemoreceptor glutamine deamidase CheD n=1 Tax=Parvibium lacunae TaxID=1888893 RepID=A0A368L9F7_9BURK|nr:chemoreceptor glutamine deamidase CheD [Parvibium lacunae]RCS59869.1 chemoreceptor glutamine deamidase CheD [Parvibium lacunae]